jgi:hypothetical protein
MIKTKTVLLTALGLATLGLAPACSVEALPDGAGSTEQALCANQDGVNAYMAALAVSTARELGRWLPTRDFQVNSSSQMLELTSYGKARCADKKCWNTQALLSMQNDSASGKVVFPGGDVLNSAALRSRLKADFERQATCNSQPDNHTGDNCPVELHLLKLDHTAAGNCDKNYYFKATQTDGVKALTEPAQLKNQLWWVGYTNDSQTNPYLSFQNNGSLVSIDPTAGLNEGDATASGSCSAACVLLSASSVAGNCCICNGATKKYARSAFSPVIYLCQ